MGKILVKAPRQKTMVDAQGNVQFMYGDEGKESGYGGALLGGLGKLIGAGLGAAGPHKSLLSLIGGMQGGAATGQQAGRYVAKPFDAAERYLRRPKKQTPDELYEQEYGKEKRRQQIRRDVSRELKPQTQEESLRQLLQETGNNPAMAQRLLNIFSGQGTEVQHNTANSDAAKILVPRLETPETSPTNTGANFDNKTGVAAGHEPAPGPPVQQPPPQYIGPTTPGIPPEAAKWTPEQWEAFRQMGVEAGQIEVPA